MVADTSNSRVGHVASSSNVDMDSVMDSFNTITSASPIADSMVAESHPVADTGQHIVGTRGNVALRCLKNAISQNIIISEMTQ